MWQCQWQHGGIILDIICQQELCALAVVTFDATKKHTHIYIPTDGTQEACVIAVSCLLAVTISPGPLCPTDFSHALTFTVRIRIRIDIYIDCWQFTELLQRMISAARWLQTYTYH